MINIGKAGVLVMLVAACAKAVAARPHKGKSRLATTQQLMDGMVHPNYLAIERATKESRVDPVAWRALANNAALLNEASYLIVDDDRSLGADWDKAARQLRTGSAELLVKIAARDKTEMESVLKVTAKACNDCHTAHR